MEIQIISTPINGELVQTSNARDLYGELGVKKDFSNWIKVQIKRAWLVENKDFVTVAQKGVGGQFDSIEYHLTINSAKHIAMLSGTARGKEVRDYYLECERRLQSQLPDFTNPAQAARAWADEVEKVQTLKQQAQLNAPKVMLADAITQTSADISLTAAAKHFGIKRDAFIAILHRHQCIFKREYYDGRPTLWEPRAHMITAGYIALKQVPDAKRVMRSQALISGKGMSYIFALLESEKQPA